MISCSWWAKVIKSGANSIGYSFGNNAGGSGEGGMESLPYFFAFVKCNHPNFQIFAFAIFSYYPTINLVMSRLFSTGRCDAISSWLCDFDESLNHHSWKSYGRVMEEVQRSPYANHWKYVGQCKKYFEFSIPHPKTCLMPWYKCMLFRSCGLLAHISQLWPL